MNVGKLRDILSYYPDETEVFGWNEDKAVMMEIDNVAEEVYPVDGITEEEVIFINFLGDE